LSETIPPQPHHILLLGGSAGSLAPLREILGSLPAKLPASVFVVIHLAPTRVSPTVVLANYTSLPLQLAEDGARFLPGVVYMAPSDRHLALKDGRMRVFRGARENGSRPAIDVLFRSAAVNHGSSVIGVLLSGALSDGSLGLAAVKRCGGTTIVQDPDDALNSSIPRSALRATRVDHCVPAARIAPLLLDILRHPPSASPPVPEDLRIEARLALSTEDPYAPAEVMGEPIPIVCPECSGPLSRVSHGGEYGYRCHVGHAYSAQGMLGEHGLALERALWVAFRALKERGILLDQMADDAREHGRTWAAQRFEERRHEIEKHAASVHSALRNGSEPPSEELEDEAAPPRWANESAPTQTPGASEGTEK
jgi:two-component system chemotaxis response regulator CheB